jgi:hypothetical protein
VNNARVKQELTRIVGEACGGASLCWIPTPTGEFDSRVAGGLVDLAVEEIMLLIRETR